MSDTEELTLGPAWLKQFSHSDVSKSQESDGLSFHLAKYQYDRDEMLSIYESLEKTLLVQAPSKALKEFDDLFQKDPLKPVLLSPPTADEQKFLSTCVNSQAALNAYNKAKGTSQTSDERQKTSFNGTRETKNNHNNGRTGPKSQKDLNTRNRDKEAQKLGDKERPRRNTDNKKEFKNGKEYKKRNYDNNRKECQPEWFDDDNNDDYDNHEKLDEKKPNEQLKKMSFDDTGKFIIEKNSDKDSTTKKTSTDDLTTKMSECLIDTNNEKLNELNQQFQQTQAQLHKIQNSNQDHASPGDNWFYLDSQNQIQGPFNSEKMANWLASGYFSMNLMVKRGCDEQFVPLGLIVQNLNNMRQKSQSVKTVPPHDPILNHMQQMSQNNNLLTAHLSSQQNSGLSNSNLNSIIQQIQQIQLQQKAAVASLSTLGVNAVAAILQELRNKQEALISQINITKQNSPIINNLLQNSIKPTNCNNNSAVQLNNADPLKEKILALFEIKRKEEEKRRRLEEEIRLKQEEEKRRLMEEARIKQLIMMSKLAKQQNLHSNSNVLLEQKALQQKLLLEQMKLKEVLSQNTNSALSNFLRQQQQTCEETNGEWADVHYPLTHNQHQKLTNTSNDSNIQSSSTIKTGLYPNGQNGQIIES
ncbi:unnamed protein product [Brachionus calyciflorus]|uniref:GYF domain-containing protein n=1 Tax=Brachionus calyciflorus TaxID=104777 RepID=A0A814ITW8_9BILA|nr:unnamed protein product [Brachionus calyciflorus]